VAAGGQTPAEQLPAGQAKGAEEAPKNVVEGEIEESA